MVPELASLDKEWHGAHHHDYLVLHAEDICAVDAMEARPKEHPHSTVISKFIQKKVLPINNDGELRTEPKRSVQSISSKCDRGHSSLEQPMFIEPINDKIKRSWCPGWTGSAKTEYINQHTRKAASHMQARVSVSPNANIHLTRCAIILFVLFS